MKEINPDKLRKQLIETYVEFSKDIDSERGMALAKELDGVWSGDFLLDEDIQLALNNLTRLYVKPRLSPKDINKILAKLRDSQ